MGTPITESKICDSCKCCGKKGGRCYKKYKLYGGTDQPYLSLFLFHAFSAFDNASFTASSDVSSEADNKSERILQRIKKMQIRQILKMPMILIMYIRTVLLKVQEPDTVERSLFR